MYEVKSTRRRIPVRASEVMAANLEYSLGLFKHLSHFQACVVTTYDCIYCTFIYCKVEGVRFKLAHIRDVHRDPLYFWPLLCVTLLHLTNDDRADIDIYLIFETIVVQILAKLGVSTSKH